jgi:ABC-type spermidine/putrescine transport system, permease component I
LRLFFAYGMRRGIWMERTITTILVLPISLGVIFLSEGILGFYGTNGWLNQMLLGADIIKEPLELTHNFIGVILSLFMQNSRSASLCCSVTSLESIRALRTLHECWGRGHGRYSGASCCL